MVLAVGMEPSIPQSSPSINIDDFRKNPHDAFFRLLMSEPKNIKAYTEHILPKAVHAACRWNELEIVQTDFIDEALNEKRSDLLYRVPCGEGVIAIHILLEHQSTYDPSMPLRLLEYMILIWRRELRLNSTLTQIVPLVLYHGSQPWVNTSLSDMMTQVAGLRFKGLSFHFEGLGCLTPQQATHQGIFEFGIADIALAISARQ